MKRTRVARRIAWLALTMVIVTTVFSLVYWETTRTILKDYEAGFKLTGLAIGPLLALLGFFWGLVDKAELKDLSEELGKAKADADAAGRLTATMKEEVSSKIERIERLERDLQTIADSSRLWQLRSNAPFADYRGWKHDPIGAKIVTIGLFKGGVGKTHLAANFAAYVSERQQLPVLLVDLDYQGSLSTAVLQAAGVEPPGSAVDALFSETADLATVTGLRIHLAARSGPDVALNGGLGLARAWLLPADYTLSALESRLLIDRVIHQKEGLDERYRLAHVLLHPSVRRDYSMIIIDTPPRMTLGTVNAIVASHAYVVPSILDRVSSEAVKPFLEQVEALKKDLKLECPLAGIVGTMTRQIEMDSSEVRRRDEIEETAKEILGNNRTYFIAQNLPRKVQVNNSSDLGYFLSDDQGPLARRFYDAIFDELWKRVMQPEESRR